MTRKRSGGGKIKEPAPTLSGVRKAARPRAASRAKLVFGTDRTKIPHVVEARHVGAFRLFLSFDDGVAGELDLASRLHGPIFEPLKDERYFAEARVNRELGTVTWPNGADFAPEFLYDAVRKAGRRS